MDDTKKLLSDLAKKIVKRGMSVPALFFLDSTKYMSFIGSQFLVFLGPIATCFINNHKYYQITDLLEDRGNIDYLLDEIEKMSIKL